MEYEGYATGDRVKIVSDRTYVYTDRTYNADPYPFIEIGNEVQIGSCCGTHLSLCDSESELHMSNRGRIWRKPKIISIWHFKNDKRQLKSLLPKLESAYVKKFGSVNFYDWYIVIDNDGTVIVEKIRDYLNIVSEKAGRESSYDRYISKEKGRHGYYDWLINSPYADSKYSNMVFEDGNEEVNESINTRLESIINECVDRCLRKYLNKEKISINESKSRQEKEQMLIDLYNYLSQEPTDDIYDGKKHLNIKHKAYNYFEPKGIVHNVWAIHYTNVEGYEGIQSRGFRIGVSDYDALAYSQGYYNNYEPPRKSGWNFALPIDNKYLGDDLGYGDCGFIIKTDGVRAYHKGDQDDEIIFKGCMVKKKIPFVYDEDYCCWILSGFGYNYKGGKLPNGAYYDEELEQVVFESIYSLIQYAIST